MLDTYLNRTRLLLANPAASSALYSDATLTNFINQARGQIAGENECVRVFAQAQASLNNRILNFTDVDVTGTPGVASIFKINQAIVTVNDGGAYMHPRSFQWFTLYYLGAIIPETGRPNTFAQYGQGSSGSLYFNPVPDDDYDLGLDCVCVPVDLTDDSTVEAIPYPWTDCVPYFAAYLAYLSAQRASDADRLFKLYETFAQRGRSMSNPMVLQNNYSQSNDQTLPNKLAAQPRSG